MTERTTTKYLARGVAICSLFVVFLRRVALFVDPDFGWHYRTGEWIATHGGVPLHDLYSYTMPEMAWYNHEWLFDYLLYKISAFPTLAILTFFLSAFIPLVYFLLSAESALATLWITAGAVMIAETVGVRAQTLSLLFFALLGVLLKRGFPLPKWARFILPIGFILWANLHGGFIGGLAILALTFLGHAFDRWRRLGLPKSVRQLLPDAMVLVTSLIATIINPYGLHLWGASLNILSTESGGGALISEWQSGFVFWPLLLPLFIAASAAIFFERKPRPSSGETLVFLTLVYEVVTHARMIGVLVVVIAPLLLPLIDSFALKVGRKERRWVEWGALLIVVLLCVNTLSSANFIAPWSPPNKALAVYQSLKREFPSGGNSLIDHNIAGYAIGIDPAEKIFTAGYLPEWRNAAGWSATEAYIDMTERSGVVWKKYFAEYDIDTVILPVSFEQSFPKPKETGVSGMLARYARSIGIEGETGNTFLIDRLLAARWCKLYQDDSEVIMRRPGTLPCK